MTGSASEIHALSYEQAYGRPFDDMLIRKPDLGRIRKLIGYEPTFTLEQTLQQIIDYHREMAADGG